MEFCKRTNTRSEFLQELIRVHKYGKMSAVDRDKLFLRGFDQCEVLPGKRSWGCEVLRSFKEEHGDCKFLSKILRGKRRGLPDKTFAAQYLAVGRVVDVGDGTVGSDECQTERSK